MFLGMSFRCVTGDFDISNVNVLTCPWSIRMGSWSACTWAGFLHRLFRQLKVCPTSVNATYKLQDVPTRCFDQDIAAAYECLAGPTDTRFIRTDVDERADLGMLFDQLLAKSVPSLCSGAIHMEDRSQCPGLRYLCGDFEGTLEAGTWKWFPTQKAYIIHRFCTAKTVLSQQEVLRYAKFVYKFLLSEGIATNGDIACYSDHRSDMEAKKGHRMEKALNTFVGCARCRRREGDHGVDGKVILSLKCCSGCDLVKYCSRGCQRADWKAHRTTCGQEDAGISPKSGKNANASSCAETVSLKRCPFLSLYDARAIAAVSQSFASLVGGSS